MTFRPRLPALVVLAVFFGAAAASAQTVGPDEAVAPNGVVSQKIGFTAAQRSAIYNAVIQERVRTAAPGIAPAIGASVPPSAALRDLPYQAAVEAPEAEILKYTMVEDDVVVVDPIGMRVVDVIHRGANQ